MTSAEIRAMWDVFITPVKRDFLDGTPMPTPVAEVLRTATILQLVATQTEMAAQLAELNSGIRHIAWLL